MSRAQPCSLMLMPLSDRCYQTDARQTDRCYQTDASVAGMCPHQTNLSTATGLQSLHLCTALPPRHVELARFKVTDTSAEPALIGWRGTRSAPGGEQTRGGSRSGQCGLRGVCGDGLRAPLRRSRPCFCCWWSPLFFSSPGRGAQQNDPRGLRTVGEPATAGGQKTKGRTGLLVWSSHKHSC